VSAARKRLKYVATINDEALGEDTDPDFEMQYVDISNVTSSGTVVDLATHRFEDAPSRARRRVRDGDVIISTVRTYLQAIAQIRQPPPNLIVSTGFAVVRPDAHVFDAQYCKYALREPEFLAEVERRSVGVSYPAINASDIASIPVYVHTVGQQRAIADYLDRETARLDALVAAKERVLGLLAEKRRALITRAVTRGLDPRAPLRDSGIPWLGEIPAHWRVMRAGLAGHILMGRQRAPQYEKGSHMTPYLRVANVFDGFIDYSDVLEMNFEPEEQALFGLAPGDVLLNEGQSRELVGRSAIYRESPRKYCFQNTLIRFRCGKNLSPEYAQAQFASWLERGVFQVFSRQSTNIAHLGSDRLAQIHMVVPPIDEQQAIIDHIECEAGKADSMRAATERTIALLKERRSALIAAAVTGQIDVESAA
jgi:type I restriction enzyme S subunit